MNNGSSRYQRQFKRNNGKFRKVNNKSDPVVSNALTEEEQKAALAVQRRRQKQAVGNSVDRQRGVELVTLRTGDQPRRGWLYNIQATTVTASSHDISATESAEQSAVDLYFLSDDGCSTFRTSLAHRPYFYVKLDLSLVLIRSTSSDVLLESLTSALYRKFDGSLTTCRVVNRVDLDQPNHLSPKFKGQGIPYLQLIFDNVQQLMRVRDELQKFIRVNQQRRQHQHSFVFEPNQQQKSNTTSDNDLFGTMMELREYDVPYVVRVCTDLNIRAGTWYTIKHCEEYARIALSEPDRETKAHPTVLAFDIECTKAPLKFPSAEVDEIFMISYMVSSQGHPPIGYLITSQTVVSGDVDPFEYTPTPKYPGPFTIFNEPNEKALLERFFNEYRRHAPHIVVTYNGDFFDWPFVQTRAEHYNLNLFQYTGVEKIQDSYLGRSSVHLDAFHWVQRDSYLPQGSQSLKAVTRYKLGYDPVEVDPEDMVRFAQERPVHMATYSVSDAVATYYLYDKYVHLFIFSLCTIIPMGPEDVLRKGSGTLCEALLMVEACNKSIICPNKHVEPAVKFHQGHLIQSETYIGGKVECLETGVYRSDIEYEFNLIPSAFQQLIDNVDRDLVFAIETEANTKKDDVENYDEVKVKIIEKLEELRDRPKRVEKPYIYHLDVGAMYPNIILTNRLQPSAIVDDSKCASCDFNQAKNDCKRKMNWIWRGDYNPATRNEYEQRKEQLTHETFDDGKTFDELTEAEKGRLVAQRLNTYASKAYNKTKVTEEEIREDIVCMRDNSFYVDTVRQFRDRRYEFKALNKTWKKNAETAKDPVRKKECEDRVLVYDSLQVAHKCILNSFYGYVMRKGARWRSMPMAGIVTKTGSDIITQARILVEQIGRPLELDTDGVWCILPVSFPDVYTFKYKDGSKLKLEYPCVMLNADVHHKFTNHQYQELVDVNRGVYSRRSECSIFFEVDGPYRCMVLPASTEEGKLLKKRYAVFNFDGSLAELKGFELKRRGELELIKTFQVQVFKHFLDGNSLEECYGSVAEVANHWIDVIDTRGESLGDEELVELISENRSMSRKLEEYGNQKGTSQTTAKRLAEFLGADTLKDKGLNCKFIIAEQPYGAPVTERAVPTAIWKAEPAVTKHFLRKWLKNSALDGDALDMRNILDWDYYLDRLAKSIQKIITIPAALQKLSNPVPRIAHPDWLTSKVQQLNDKYQQQNIVDLFKKQSLAISKNISDTADIEGNTPNSRVASRPVVHTFRRRDKEKPNPSVVVDNLEPPKKVSLISDNFNDWLKLRKSQWRKRRKDHQSSTNPEKAATSVDKRAKNNMSVEGYVREAEKILEQNELQVIEVREISGYNSPDTDRQSTGSGQFNIWVLVRNKTVQKLTVTVPRTFCISCLRPVDALPNSEVELRKVEKSLPHNKPAKFLYEITVPEYMFRSGKWIDLLRPADGSTEEVVESMYGTSTPLLTKVLTQIGSICKFRSNSQNSRSSNYILSDLSKVIKPLDGEYLNPDVSFRRVYLYIRMNESNNTGLVALYFTNAGSGSFKNVEHQDSSGHNEESNVVNPTSGPFNIGATCTFWIIKPSSSQKSTSRKQVEEIFHQVIQSLQQDSASESPYSCVSPSSRIGVSKINFVPTEKEAFAAVSTALGSYIRTNQGPCFILLNSSQSFPYVRRYVSVLNNLPVLHMSFPPQPAHNPAISTLPALNWDLPIIQLSFEAYLHILIVSFPTRVSYARYGQIPIGNLSEDENVSLFDVCLSQLIDKNRVVPWASNYQNKPDLGISLVGLSNSGVISNPNNSALTYDQELLWNGEEELISPVVEKPGTYRSVCVDLDVHDLATATLTNSANAMIMTSSMLKGSNALDGLSVLQSADLSHKSYVALGDEMTTSVSLYLIRVLAIAWLRDALQSGNVVADELSHQIYRLITSPDSLYYDPALHRVVHALMKTSFYQLLGELQHLGCSIVCASFYRITVATNKTLLADAEEYINFVVDTVQKRAFQESEELLPKVTLRPRKFHTHLIFLDQYNYGTISLRRANVVDMDDEVDFCIPEDDGSTSVVVSEVESAWSVINYLGSEVAQEYFRTIVARFSKNILQKQTELMSRDESVVLLENAQSELLAYKKKTVSKQFAFYLTRAVGEVLKDEQEDYIQPFFSKKGQRIIPALEFIKNVTTVLELDADVLEEVHVLRRSLLSQIGVAEYNRAADWKNPCSTLVLPDVYCVECQESRDINLCFIPPMEREVDDTNGEGEVSRRPHLPKDWSCVDCGFPYDVALIEQRLLQRLHQSILRYQMQDLRCRKTNHIARRLLADRSYDSNGLVLDITRESMLEDINLLERIADLHKLELLQKETRAVLDNYRH